MTNRQRQALYDLMAVIAETDAATPAQRVRATQMAERLLFDIAVRRFHM